jgi:hypothetical protein
MHRVSGLLSCVCIAGLRLGGPGSKRLPQVQHAVQGGGNLGLGVRDSGRRTGYALLRAVKGAGDGCLELAVDSAPRENGCAEYIEKNLLMKDG